MKKTITMLILLCVAAFAQQKGSFTDSRDNKTYKTVKIGKQTWMVENLNYNASGSKCYDNKPANCDKYGRLYDWKTAKTACPKGWRLPSGAEWDVLIAAVGGEDEAGKVLKATSGWNKSGNGTDKFGFAALPGGWGNSNGDFGSVGNRGDWWTATESITIYNRIMYYDEEFSRDDDYMHYVLFSIRCLQD